jgi:hypothetical protein
MAEDAPNVADLRLAAEHAQKLASQYAGVVKMGEVLGQIGSIEQAITEANARLKAARDAEAKAVVDYEATKKKLAADHADAVNHANNNVAAVNKHAESIMKDARDDVKAIIAEAEAKAVLVREQAQARAAEVDAQTHARAADLHTIRDDIDKTKQDLMNIVTEHNQRLYELEHLREQHTAFLTKIGATAFLTKIGER